MNKHPQYSLPAGVQIVGMRHDLLGARLNSFMNALRIGNQYDMGAAMFWPLTGSNAVGKWNKSLIKPEEVFSKTFIDSHFITEPPSSRIWPSLPFAEIGKHFAVRSLDEFIARRDDGQKFCTRDRINVTSLSWEDRDETLRDFSRIFYDSIGYSDCARKAMESFEKTLAALSAPTVGVHARRGDIIRNEITLKGSWRGMYYPDEIIFFAIRKIFLSGRNVQIFCSDLDFVSRARSKFPEILFSSTFSDLDLQTEILFDFMDVYQMSRCETVLASGVSAFSSIGCNAGNVPLIRFSQYLEEEELEEADQAAFSRFQHEEQSFLCHGDMAQTANYLLGRFMENCDDEKFGKVVAFCRERNISIERYIDSLEPHPNFARLNPGRE